MMIPAVALDKSGRRVWEGRVFHLLYTLVFEVPSFASLKVYFNRDLDADKSYAVFREVTE